LILSGMVADMKARTCVGLVLFERKKSDARQDIYYLNYVLHSCNSIEFATLQIPLLKRN
jgi:hypothetical protein